MSLDILKCKVVSPQQANNTYSVESNPYLRKIQPTGFVCVNEYRVGRNCLNKDWHLKWELTQGSPDWDCFLESDVQFHLELEKNKMIIVYPDEVKEKILFYLDLEDGFLNSISDNDFDFLYISW